jgi:hypothetical protein
MSQFELISPGRDVLEMMTVAHLATLILVVVLMEAGG